MKIYSLSNILILPLVLAIIGIFYYSESIGDKDFTIWVFIPVFLLTALLIFKPQVDFWWHTRHPLPLDPAIRKWLSTYAQNYKSLNPGDQKKYEDRLSLYMEGREFKSVGQEVRDVPEDIKGIIGSIPVMITMNQEDYLLGEYNRVFLYKHPFPSPQHQYLHSVEVNHEDGVILFSLEHLLPGLTRSREFFNIGLYGYLDAYFHINSNNALSHQELTWVDIEKTGLLTEEHITSVTGLKDFNFTALAAVNFYIFPERMKVNNPDLFREFMHIFHSSIAAHEL
jgi:hypothetical protein